MTSPVTWEIVVEDTGLPIFYGGRISTIDAWVVRCLMKVAEAPAGTPAYRFQVTADVMPRSKRGSGHHIRQTLRRMRERLPRPDRVVLYRTGGRPRWWREGLATSALMDHGGGRVQVQTRPRHEASWAALEVWGLSQDLAMTAPHEDIVSARRRVQAWATSGPRP